MAVDSVVTQSAVGIDGNNYTTAISNDKLSNNDFVKLLLEEMKMQDPTKPMDSDKLMDDQLKMSQIQSNSDMTKALQTLIASSSTSSLSSAVGLMNQVVEDGSTNKDTGLPAQYRVETLEKSGDTIYVNAREIENYYSDILYKDEPATYDSEGNIYDSDGDKVDYHIKLEKDGKVAVTKDGYMYYDSDGNLITDEDDLEDYKININLPNYAESLTKIDASKLTKISG